MDEVQLKRTATPKVNLRQFRSVQSQTVKSFQIVELNTFEIRKGQLDRMKRLFFLVISKAEFLIKFLIEFLIEFLTEVEFLVENIVRIAILSTDFDQV